ncbi:hypothetical protein KSD_32250 [Ktedonobacter sp. SOSP1-85]|nr:hypothetical protein KSD_32250 [Ktedonobacter sp. SOSP1-85]
MRISSWPQERELLLLRNPERLSPNGGEALVTRVTRAPNGVGFRNKILVGVKRTLHTDDILYLAQATQDALNLIQHAFSGHDF